MSAALQEDSLPSEQLGVWVTQSCLTFHAPMDCSPPGFSVHGILQAKEYWRGLPSDSPGDFPNPEMEAGSPALQTAS